jgi:hypothetical protein
MTILRCTAKRLNRILFVLRVVNVDLVAGVVAVEPKKSVSVKLGRLIFSPSFTIIRKHQ